MFALWTWTGHGAGPAPDLGDPEALTLALPVGERGAIEPVETPTAVVTPRALAALEGELAPSALAWRALLAPATGSSSPTPDAAGPPHSAPHPNAPERAAATPPSDTLAAPVDTRDTSAPSSVLPPAAHAVPDAVGAAIVSAARALRVLRDTEAIGAELAQVLDATLRPYQVRGVSWLHETVAAYGGAVLADEMGLGKTVQAIGFLQGRADGPQLVVCPTSLVGNWVHEIARFAPGLTAHAWRGGEVVTGAGTVLVTGYPTLRLHGARLHEHQWATVVFDEAQALKNPRTQVSKAARALPTAARIALTGTPVENHLDELFALLNLTAPRLFAHRTQFRRRFVRPIEEGSAAAAARLRDAVEPVVLGRKKIQVAAALPAKIHTDLLCDLSAEQERVYDAALARAVEEGFGSGLQRQGRILAALTELKQVCNHPGLASGDLDELTGRSGKLDLCTDIVATNLDTGDPTLIFTQYRKTGELLVRHLAEQFGVAAPFFHGGLDATRRGEIVTEFQSVDGPPVLILSLRAAGTGLTLTRAADVIHFDRWWNPAVEAQASDRVHRIGQTRTVTVTTLTSATTVEEHIATMHTRKSALTDLSDAAGIAELARLDDDALVDILRRKREN
ncbi:DEAD/DEAH box helicase [Nocardia mangyaensis]|uniref:DEAD/DEAH box helicase n=1 Tax=Nocardia mangyaensis TaxID=2213200 RepID=UPI002676AAC0|nr:DEAD/DEAH box helicase [Nocardia mangyaensis]MDO3649009.1 SNF2-related protein [Nocardia mangyaensis]